MVLTRIPHKDCLEKTKGAMDKGKHRLRGTARKILAGILFIRRECFLGCNAVDMVLFDFGVRAYLYQISCEKCGLNAVY